MFNKKITSLLFCLAAFIALNCAVSNAATVAYTYDSLNRVISVDYGDEATEGYTYDAAGNRTSIVTSFIVVNYYCDNDSDGYYDSLVDDTCSGANCPPAGCQATQGNDCDDSDNTVYPSAIELCDNKNNDCNANTADGSGETWYNNPTTCGVGECASTGTLSCVAGSMVDSCVAGSPTVEVCDGLDNDCDGAADNGIASTPTTCGVGECASTGTLSCQNGSMVNSCVAGSPTTEVCDGKDNDCDGTADDGITSTPTTCGIGECASTGTLSCQNGSMVNSCVAGSPTTEVCDGKDNDCDGTIDENLTRPTTCGAGACAGNTGTETCSAGNWGNDTCNPFAGAATEICGNGVDENCDGNTDEGCVTCTDNDGDGYNAEAVNCGPQDCDDSNATVNPGMTEIAGNGKDDDCNPATQISLFGEINNDDLIDISDVILVLRMALKLDPVQPCSDLNNDGIVDISDVILTLRMALKLDPLQQCI